MIAGVCYAGAEEAVAAVFRLFYETVKPTVELLRPSEGEVHSGLIGVPFEAKAKSYGRQFTDQFFVFYVRFQYSDAEIPTEAEWVLVWDAVGFDEESKYTDMWHNDEDRDPVWVRARAVDIGQCESLPMKARIKIDSTRPTVTNKHP